MLPITPPGYPVAGDPSRPTEDRWPPREQHRSAKHSTSMRPWPTTSHESACGTTSMGRIPANTDRDPPNRSVLSNVDSAAKGKPFRPATPDRRESATRDDQIRLWADKPRRPGIRLIPATRSKPGQASGKPPERQPALRPVGRRAAVLFPPAWTETEPSTESDMVIREISGLQSNRNRGACARSDPTPLLTYTRRPSISCSPPAATALGTGDAVIGGPNHGRRTCPPCVWPAMRRSTRVSGDSW